MDPASGRHYDEFNPFIIIFRPTHLKAADELEKPVAEQLDENVMPDFEFDEDDASPSEEDLPWCPEEPEEVTSSDCETSDLSLLSTTQLIELKQKCKVTAPPDRLKLIEKLILIKTNGPVPSTTDRAKAGPPTFFPNCSTSPSDLKSAARIEQFRKECPCENETSKMSTSEFVRFKNECLDQIEVPGRPFIRKNSRCSKLQNMMDSMSKDEYEKFEKDCLVKPKFEFTKILVVKKDPACIRVNQTTLGKMELKEYKEKCVILKSCDDIDQTTLTGERLTQYNILCPKVIRKTINLCDTINPDSLDDEEFEEYKSKCFFISIDFCDSASKNLDSLNDEDYEKYRRECLKKETRMDCENVKKDELNDEEYKKYEKECVKTIDCSNVNPDTLNDVEYEKYEKDCFPKEKKPFNCATVNPEKLSRKAFRLFQKECNADSPDCSGIDVRALSSEEFEEHKRKCQTVKRFNCSDTALDTENMTKEEYEAYLFECPRPKVNPIDCNSVQPNELSGKQLEKYRKECVKKIPECDDVDVYKLSVKEYREYKKRCSKEISCENINLDELSEREYALYKDKCSPIHADVTTPTFKSIEVTEPADDSECDGVDTDNMSDEQYDAYQAKCFPDEKVRLEKKVIIPKIYGEKGKSCKEVDTDKMTLEEYNEYQKTCGEESDHDCAAVEPKTLTREAFLAYLERCGNHYDNICTETNINNLTSIQFDDYKRNCLSPKTPTKELSNPPNGKSPINCTNVNVEKLSDVEYSEYKKNCEKSRSKPCDMTNTEDLSSEEYAAHKKRCGQEKRVPKEKVIVTKKVIIKTPTGVTVKNCSDIEVDKLSDEEYKEYKINCLPPKRKTLDCEDEDVNQMTSAEYEDYKRRCETKRSERPVVPESPERVPKEKVIVTKKVIIKTPTGVTVKNCSEIEVDKLSDEEYKEYKINCLPPKRKTLDCEDEDVNQMTSAEYEDYKRRCVTERSERPVVPESAERVPKEKVVVTKKVIIKTPTGVTVKNCSEIEIDKLSDEEYKEYKINCLPPKRKTLDCEDEDVNQMTSAEYEDYKRRCETKRSERPVVPESPERVPKEKVIVTKKVIIKTPTGVTVKNCSDIEVDKLSDEEYKEYKINCLPPKRKTLDCEDEDVNQMTSAEYEDYKRRCVTKRPERPVVPESPERVPKEKVIVTKKVIIKTPTGVTVKNCSDIEVDKLSDEEYKEYKINCLPPKRKTLDCEDEDVNQMTSAEYEDYKRRCETKRSERPVVPESPERVPKEKVIVTKKVIIKTPTGVTVKNCSEIEVDKLSDEEYKEYKINCLPPKRKTLDCEDEDVNQMTSAEYEDYKRRCVTERSERPVVPESAERVPKEKVVVTKKVIIKTPTGVTVKNCSEIEIDKLSDEEYKEYKINCLPPKRKTLDCEDEDVNQMTSAEYEDYKRRCVTERSERPVVPESPERVPKEKVIVTKKVIIKTPTGVTVKNCSEIEVDKLSDEEYKEYKINCLPPKRKTLDCEDEDVNQMTSAEYEDYKRRCVTERSERPVVPESAERVPKEKVVVTKKVIIKTPTGVTVKNCSEIEVDKLSDEEFKEYKINCLPPKRKTLDCEDEDINHDDLSRIRRLQEKVNIKIEELSDKEFRDYKKRCGQKKPQQNVKPPRDTKFNSCSSVNVTKLSDDEFAKYREMCRTRKVINPVVPNNEKPCSEVNIEELNAEEYASYKQRCRQRIKPENPDSSETPACSNVRVEELSAEEYAVYKKRCMQNPLPEDDNCSKIDVSTLSVSEYRRYRKRCPEIHKKIVVNREKIVKIIPEIPFEGDRCLNRDVNKMNDRELREFRKHCGEFRKTFQFNCNADVSKMSDREFIKFRKACGKKKWNCETTDAESLSDEDYEKFSEKCGHQKLDYCRRAKIEQMDSEEYAQFKKKCGSIKIKTSSDSCIDVKVEELTKEEYIAYKAKCLKNPSSTRKERRRINCSVVDSSQLSTEELAEFKKHCKVSVQTDRYRPGENIILTKKVKVHTEKEEFSCYDQDVDRMTDEEYAEFEKICLQAPHFRYDCSTVDNTILTREEYAEYQKKCQVKITPEPVKLVQKLIIKKNATKVKDGCYDRDVEIMSDEEYSEYEVRCLGLPPRKIERKSTIDCHNVDFSKISFAEIEETIRKCRSRETASTPAPPRRRQSLRCSDGNPDKMNDNEYQKWVRECQKAPEKIELKRILFIDGAVTSTPLPMRGGQTLKVEKMKIARKTRPDDDESSPEGSENFRVRVNTLTPKEIRTEVPDDDSESEAGVVLVKKATQRIPRRRRPSGYDEDENERGVIKVNKMVMKTGRREPDVNDYEEQEEILRRPRVKIGPREEVVLISVTKRHRHPYRPKNRPIEDEPMEIVKLSKNIRHPEKVLREVRIRKNFGIDIVGKEPNVEEVGTPEFKITRKTVMVPHRIRKLKPTTTTTTTTAEPEYYYDEEEVPQVVVQVKVKQSIRPIPKHMRPVDDDEEFVDVKEDQPQSYTEYEGFVKVRIAPRKIQRRPRFMDSEEEPEIREVTRKVVMQPGGEYDDLKGVKLQSHRKILIPKNQRKEYPEDVERVVTVVKKFKVMKIGEDEKENKKFDEHDGEDDGQIIVRNEKRKYPSERKRPDDDEEAEEFVEGRVVVKRKTSKKLGSLPLITEENSQFRKIGGSVEEEEKTRRRSSVEILEKDEKQRRRQRNDNEQELRRRKGRQENVEAEKIVNRSKKIKSLETDEDDVPEQESVILSKTKVLRFDQRPDEVLDENYENEDIRLKRRKLYRIGREGDDVGDDQDGVIVKIAKKKVIRFGPDGRRVPEDQSEEVIKEIKKIKISGNNNDNLEEDNEIEKRKKEVFTSSPKFLRLRKGSKLTNNESDEVDGEVVKVISKKRRYRIGPNGEKQFIEDEENSDKTLVSRNPIKEKEEMDMMEPSIERRRIFYKTGPDGKKHIIRTETIGGDEDQKNRGVLETKKHTMPLHDEEENENLQMNKRFFKLVNGKKVSIGKDEYDIIKKRKQSSKLIKADKLEEQDGEKITVVKKKISGINNDHSEKDGEKEKWTKETFPTSTKFLKIRKSLSLPNNDVDGVDDEEVKLVSKKIRYRIGPNGKRYLIENEGSSEKKKSVRHHPMEGEDMQITKSAIKGRRIFYKKGPDGKKRIIRTETIEGGRDQKNHGVPRQDENNDEITSANKKYFKIENGKKVSVGKEEYETIQKQKKRRELLGTKEHTYSPEPLEQAEKESKDVKVEKNILIKKNQNEKMFKTIKQRDNSETNKHSSQFLKLRENSKLIDDEADNATGEEIKLMSRKRHYRIGRNGKKHLIDSKAKSATGNSRESFEDGENKSEHKNSQEMSEQEMEESEDDQASSESNSRSKDVDSVQQDSAKKLKPTALIEPGFLKGGFQDPVNESYDDDSNGDDSKDDDNGNDVEYSKRRKRKILEDVNLGDVLRGRTREGQDESSSNELPIVGSTRSKKSTEEKPMSQNQDNKARKYPGDQSLRMAGKSEEDVPEAQ
uniref:Uncharacterized protein n=1 Tax=Caenorhabditis japonica TaxID=281687 RepID=A0A8R1DMR1_CAEJA